MITHIDELRKAIHLTEAEFLEYVQHDRFMMRKSLALNTGITPLVQMKLFEQNDLRYSLAENPSLCEEVQWLFLKSDCGETIRLSLVQNIGVLEEVKEKIYEIKFDEASIYWKLNNIDRVLDFKEQINWLNYEWDLVRQYLAKNLHLDREIQLKLAEDESEDVCKILAENISITYETQSILVKRNNLNVCQILALNPSIEPRVQYLLSLPNGHRLGDVIQWSLVKNPSLCLDVQKILVCHTKSHIRASLAKNPIISDEIINLLVEDESTEVRKWLATNPSICESIMRKLAVIKDDSEFEKHVLWHLARFANLTSTALREHILEQAEKFNHLASIKKALADNDRDHKIVRL